MSIKLTYFNIQGAAEKIRLALALKGIPFEDERLNKDQWNALKPKTKFGQLPMITVGGTVEVAQSDAILRYVATLPGAWKLMPDDAMEQMKVNEVLGVAADLDRAYLPGLYLGMAPEKFGHEANSQATDAGKARTKELREKFCSEELPKFMAFYEQFIGAGNGNEQFICGPELTIADCVILPQLAKFQAGFVDYIPKDVLDAYPKVTAYMERVRAVPAVAAWYAPK